MTVGRFGQCSTTLAALLAALIASGCAGDGDGASVATPTVTTTATSEPTATAPPTDTVPPTATLPPTATPSSLPSPSSSATLQPTDTATVPPTNTSTPLPSETPTAEPTATDTTIPTETPTPTITATPTNTVRADLPEGLAVGFAKRDISPNLQVAPPDGQVYLGGYGFGPGRRSNGILMPIYVRAMVISDGERVTAFAETETQGMFAKYRPNLGDVGLVDIGIAIEEATGGRISREAVMIGSDHSHSGPDAIGVWGGVRNTYLAHLRAQAIAAILDAFNKMQPAQLKVGTAEASALLTSQFDEPPNDVTDGELRVLAAVERDNPERIFGVMINYAAHSTVMGSDNRLVSGDWPSVVSANLEEQLQIDTALVMLADCGRTQPRRGDFGGEDQYQALENYGAAVTERVNQALTNAVPAQTGAIASSQRFIRERYDNDFLSLQLLSAVVLRNLLPPWGDGEIVGTLVSAVRVGELLFTAIPGEGYPEIQFKMEQQVPAQEHFIFGLANDQLGYLIAPLEGFPQIHAAAPGNDNAVFNISPEIGDHVMCTLLKSARDIGFDLPADPDKCETWGSEDNELPY